MLELGSRRELFVDHFLLESLDNCRLELNRPTPANVAMAFDMPWEGKFVGYLTVMQDTEHGVVRLYYRGWPDVGSPVEDGSYCYAESEDGIEFNRPSLDLHEWHGDTDTNIILKGGDPCHSFAPVIDTRPGCPEGERFKGIGLGHIEVDGKRKSVLFAWVSADGVTWNLMHDKPIITDGMFDSQNIAFWSAHEQCYVAYYRTKRDNTTPSDGTDVIPWRTVSRAVSDDFINWRDAGEMTYGDTPMEELYTNQTMPYARAPHIYLSFPKRFNPGRRVLTDAEAASLGHHERYINDISDGVFMTTRGGFTYDRTFMEAFVRPGEDRGNWCSRTNMSAWGIVQTGPRELSLYYQHRYAAPSHYLMRYTLGLDRFASIRGPYAGGEAITKPFTYTGRQLMLNYDTSGAGGVRVEMQDEAGKPLPGLSLDDCSPKIGDEIEGVVHWGQRTDVAEHAGKTVRLRFSIADADVYALQFV